MAIKGQSFDFSVALYSQSNGDILLSPTIESADFEISTDDGAYASLTNTPTVTPTGGGLVSFSITSSEVGNEKFSVKMIDSTGSQWQTMFYHETVVPSEWDRAYADHTTAGTFGKLMDQLRKANQAIDGSIDGASTTTSLNTDVTGYTDEAFDHELLLFVSGTLEGESRPILTYNGTTGVMTFEEPWTSAPSVADEFVLLPAYIHARSEITDSIWSELQSGYTSAGTFGNYLDAKVSEGGSGGTVDANLIEVQGQPVTLDDLNLFVDYWNPLQGNVLRLTRGDTYEVSINTEINISDKSFLDLTGVPNTGGELTIQDLGTGQPILEDHPSTTVNVSTKTVTFELTGTQTSGNDWLVHNNYKYRIAVRFPGDKVVTLLRGTCIIADSLD